MTPLMAAGVELMLIGMGTVFVFLTLLVMATSLMSRAAMRWAPVPTSPTNASLGEEEVAAIAMAIAMHRSSGGTEKSS